MCHIVLMLPLLALPIFWLWPVSVTVPVYGVIVLISAGVYYLAIQAMRRPVEIGQEKLLGSTGEVVHAEERAARIRVEGEIWMGRAAESLHNGDRVEVVGMEGLVVRVRRLNTDGDAAG